MLLVPFASIAAVEKAITEPALHTADPAEHE